MFEETANVKNSTRAGFLCTVWTPQTAKTVQAIISRNSLHKQKINTAQKSTSHIIKKDLGSRILLAAVLQQNRVEKSNQLSTKYANVRHKKGSVYGQKKNVYRVEKNNKVCARVSADVYKLVSSCLNHDFVGGSPKTGKLSGMLMKNLCW